ncbi:hypothetical protein AB4Y45_33365 [Paraburkholderia sp. EG287A]|uniref:hypothetical protein n=1 Tax=Paraburkholderia sp. EG287A TaxID=3237012 RepID=UPI0034D1A9F0
MTELVARPAAPDADAFRSLCLPTARKLPLTAHPLLGAVLLEQATRAQYEVEKVFEGWWKGTYQLAVARERESGRHAVVVVGHDNCLSESVVEQFDLFRRRFEVADVPAPEEALTH